MSISNPKFVSPAAITLLFPYMFAEKPFMGGFKSPCGGPNAKHDKLLLSAVAATYLHMAESGLIRMRMKKEGFLLKRDRIYVTPLSPAAGQVSYLTRGLTEVGAEARLSSLIKEPVKVFSPVKYLIQRIWEWDVKGRISCSDAERLRPEAEALRAMLRRYEAGGSKIMEAIERELKMAVDVMTEEIRDDDDDEFFFGED